MNDIFHVHTYRCGHAENILDETYITRAIELGANSITFTDHAPFPENPFGSRMAFSELPEYISSLVELKGRYKEIIDVKIGLEIEYLPSFKAYYHELSENENIDLLMIGQHFFEIEPGKYSFSYPEVCPEYIGCLSAITEGINTGLFQVVAHPDRAFRKIKIWTSECDIISKKVIDAASKNNVALELNFASMNRKNNYWDEFWKLTGPENKIIEGIDAHKLKDIDKYCERNVIKRRGR